MPSSFEPVSVPPELRRTTEEKSEPPDFLSVDFVRDLFALLLIILGAALSSVGVAYWAQPMAGVAILGLELFVVGCFMGYKR